MTDEILRNLAERVGVSTHWRTQTGEEAVVSPETLRAVLTSLGYPAHDDGEVRNALSALDAGVHWMGAQSRFATARVQQPAPLPFSAQGAHSIEVTYESGATRVVTPIEGFEGALTLPPFETPGYHVAHLPSGDVTVATAPERCITFADLNEGRPGWGAAAQVYSLRSRGDGGAGDFGSVGRLAQKFGKLGADVLAISPVHALFGAEPRHYSPYSPSTRLFYNPVYADPWSTLPEALVRDAMQAKGVNEAFAAAGEGRLIDWPAAHTAKLALLGACYRLLTHSAEPIAQEFRHFLSQAPQLLKDHALFEALHTGYLKRAEPLWDWRAWPEGFRRPTAADAQAYAEAHAHEIDLQVFLQWLTGRSYGEAHRQAREAGMKVGLVADLAIGMAPSGSHAWSRQEDVLHGLSIGAPPDFYSETGQNWGLTTFSPRGLAASGFTPFIDTLRACLRHAGGLRIDHVMGMSRLWLVPEGGSATEGTYVSFPAETMFRLIALESWRHGAIVIGEDLGTLPFGFHDYLQDQGVAGMRVIRFERDEHNGYLPARDYTPTAVAMTSTHDMIACAGWWTGADLDDGPDRGRVEEIRAWDRGVLWHAYQSAGLVQGDRPADNNPQPVVDAAVGWVAQSPCTLKIVAVEDLVGSEAQPNVPGTTDEKPNWRIRFDLDADAMGDAEPVKRRAGMLSEPRAQ